MKTNRLAAVLVASVMALAGTTGCASSTGTAAPAASTAAASTSGAVLPVDTNPIANSSTTAGLSITYAAVEDNVDPDTQKALSDQLELTIDNATSSEATGLEVFYTMTDVTTGQTESYYQDLGSLTIPAKSSTTIYFDGGTGVGHYPENKYSIYRSSSNQVDFTIEVSAAGLKPVTTTATKGVGTGEVAD